MVWCAAQIHIAEAAVDEAKKRAVAAAECLDAAKLALRETQAAEMAAKGTYRACE